MTDGGGVAASELAGRIARLAQDRHITVAAAESVTAGTIAVHLAAAESAGKWFGGSVVAYAAEVKFKVLGVAPGPVITATAARQMATGVTRLLGAQVAVASTGAGGPGREEGRPAGTVFIAVAEGVGSRVHEYHFEGDPGAIVADATVQALSDLLDHCLHGLVAVPAGTG